MLFIKRNKGFLGVLLVLCVLKSYSQNSVTAVNAPPTFQVDEIIHPSYTDNSKTLKITVNGCEAPNTLLWLKGDGTEKIVVMDDPYNCKEFQVACVIGNDTLRSNVISPASVHPIKNEGYSKVFEYHLSKLLYNYEPDDDAEMSFRWLFQNFLGGSRYDLPGQKFVKYYFDYIASHLQCARGIDLRRRGNYYDSFTYIANYHVEQELMPGLSTYARTLYTCQDLDKWKVEHEQYLNETCKNSFFWVAVATSLGDSRAAYVFAAEPHNIAIARGVRDALIAARKRELNCGVVVAPSSLTKADLITTETDILNVLSVKAEVDTAFFIKAKASLQLKITKRLPDGSIVDLTHASSGTTYSSRLDTSIVKISADGLITVKRTSLPYINNRLPLFIRVTNGSDDGYGQFAIYDSDTDNDYLADTYEEKAGLNPNVTNASNADTDGDGIKDLFEASLNTSPIKYDSDGDGFRDGLEILKGTDAMNRLSYPAAIYSIKSGQWNDPYSWSCICVPSADDAVIIKAGHKIELNANIGQRECIKLDVEKGAVFNCTGVFKTLLK